MAITNARPFFPVNMALGGPSRYQNLRRRSIAVAFQLPGSEGLQSPNSKRWIIVRKDRDALQADGKSRATLDYQCESPSATLLQFHDDPQALPPGYLPLIRQTCSCNPYSPSPPRRGLQRPTWQCLRAHSLGTGQVPQPCRAKDGLRELKDCRNLAMRRSNSAEAPQPAATSLAAALQAGVLTQHTMHGRCS
jgi:hypothetical protein